MLEGEAALRLWRKGQDAWNRWIDEHPSWDISFADADFSRKRDAQGNLSFAGYNFGNANVSFYGATFGDSKVDFSNATFSEGVIVFSEAMFDGGEVYFDQAIFGDADVLFFNAIFGDGRLSFFGATFGNGSLYLSGVRFGDGEIKLREAQIKDLYFNPSNARSIRIKAEGLSIKGQAFFSLPPSDATLKSFSLHSASFDGPLTLTGDLSIIPDLRATRYSHQVDLSALNIKLPRVWRGFGWPPKLSRMAENSKDGAKLRRLKEIAEINKDHQAALRFSADENRAKRWIETSWAGSVLDMAFSFFSDYGQSILRPFFWLLAIFLDWASIYCAFATETFSNWWTGLAQAAILSTSNSLPFLPQSRDLRTDALTALYGTDHGLWVDALMITQGVLSFIFLFLIGLGLRNRFRL